MRTSDTPTADEAAAAAQALRDLQEAIAPACVQVVDLVAYRQAAQAGASSAAMDELTRESERLNLGY